MDHNPAAAATVNTSLPPQQLMTRQEDGAAADGPGPGPTADAAISPARHEQRHEDNGTILGDLFKSTEFPDLDRPGETKTLHDVRLVAAELLDRSLGWVVSRFSHELWRALDKEGKRYILESRPPPPSDMWEATTLSVLSTARPLEELKSDGMVLSDDLLRRVMTTIKGDDSDVPLVDWSIRSEEHRRHYPEDRIDRDKRRDKDKKKDKKKKDKKDKKRKRDDDQ
ncbi:unnamed protein product [Vitrella brassicaformis CCMP3155]|uniref:Uncharacterized protein n=1 Tax=Vitrella brassicaformis (strain CCMP3155) TaxID=1169540 RepID=A0A0G4FWF2_VITBC|nr:unnamed protein product [Vitrella brassicaformis CCMP3155]|eukprot:CEM19458.1 unnamed protein product [Vitrella brassicaformis CCMP3155]